MQPQTILITGVTRRVGAHLANHLLDAGHRVIGSYRHDTDALEMLVEKGLIALPLDLLERDRLEAFAAEVAGKADRLDLIVHNASIWHGDADCAADPTLATAMYTVHVTSPIELTEALQRALPARERDDGRADRQVVFLTDAHIDEGDPEHIHYIASKAAIESSIRSLALRYAPHTRVNAIAPGLLMFHPDDDPAYRRQRLARRLLPFEPGPGVVAETIDYLLACPLINQAVIRLDTGRRWES
ncbi:SDR family NAD(P)-dependent oxidoreductase [Guyparkeria sp. 1SP6A2]|nr:SDR family NAD(P)-dependent oxidoreductase [Guyparkeria sp. 1SP6A2]